MPIDSDIAAELPVGHILEAKSDIFRERKKRCLATPVNTNTLHNRISRGLLLTSSITSISYLGVSYSTAIWPLWNFRLDLIR